MVLLSIGMLVTFTANVAFSEEVRFNEWMVREFSYPADLPNEVARDVLESQDGSIWIATWGGGVIKMNGIDIVVYNRENGLVSNDARALAEDRFGRIWVATAAGISCIARDTIFNFSSKTVPVFHSDNSFFSICELDNGDLWFGDGLGHLLRFHPTTTDPERVAGEWSLLYHFKHNLENKIDDTAIRKIVQRSPDRILLAVVDLGLIECVIQNRPESFEWKKPLSNLGMDSCFSFYIQSDTEWCGGSVTSFYIVSGEEIQTLSTPAEFTSVYSDRAHLFVGTSNGLFIVDQDRFHHFPLTDDLRKLYIECISASSDGTIWVGTRSGLFRLSKTFWSHATFNQQEGYGNSLAADENGYLYTIDQLSNLWMLNENGWSLLENFSISIPYQAPVDLIQQDNYLYLFTPGILIVYDRKNRRTVHQYSIPKEIQIGGKHQIVPIQDELWFTSNDGVLQWDGERFVSAFSMTDTVKRDIYTVIESGPGELWFGGRGWIGRWNGQEFKNIEFGNSISIDALPVMDSLVSRDGELWFATLGQGILRLNETGWTHESIRTGMPSNYIWTLFQSNDGTIWAGDRNFGVLSFRDNRWIKYGPNSGLPAGAVMSIVEDYRHRIWVGIDNGGIYSFTPDRNPPTVSITSAPKELVPDAQGVFSFEGYDAWNITPASELAYSWRIIDEHTHKEITNWSNFTTKNSALIPPLRPGYYEFQVRSQDIHRNTSPAAAAVSFHVAPYFWMTNVFWFLILSSFSSASIVLYIWLKRYHALMLSEERFKTMVEQDTHTLILHWNHRRQLTYANECAQQVLALHPAKYGSINVQEKIFDLPDDQFRSLFHLSPHETGHAPRNQLIQLKTRGLNGSEHWISWLFRAVDNSPRTGVEYHAFGIDITRQHQVEEELVKERSDFNEFCEAAQIGILCVSNQMKLITVNQAMAVIAGFESVDAMMNHENPLCWTDPNQFSEFCRSLFARRQSRSIQLEGVQANTNSPIHVIMYGVIKEDFAEIIVLDQTDQRRLEKEIVLTSTLQQQKLGRDIHDTIVQELTGISYLTQVLFEKLSKYEIVELHDISQLVDMINEVRDQVRKIAKGLCPINYDKFGLQSALRELLLNYQNVYNIKFHFNYKSDIQLPDGIAATNLYYIIHEAVMNAIKHAGAGQITLSIFTQNQCLHACVEDDGIGAIDTTTQDGMGIRIMKYRANLIDAQLRIHSEPGKGTVVECVIPIRSSALTPAVRG